MAFETILNEFEETLNMPAKDWKENEMRALVSNEVLLGKLISKESLEAFVKQLNDVNPTFCDEYIAPAFFTILIQDKEEEFSKLIKDYEDGGKKDSSKIVEAAKIALDDSNDFIKMIGGLTFANFSDDIEALKAYKDALSGAFRHTLNIVSKNSVENLFILDTEWIEIVYSLQQLFFEKTEIDLLDENDKAALEEMQRKINEFTLKLATDFNEQLNAANKKDENKNEEGSEKIE